MVEEIRKLAPEECEEADLLWLQCFEHGALHRLEALPDYRAGLEDRIVRFGLWDAVGMQAQFQMYNIQLKFGPVNLPGTYISSICTRPAARSRGYGAAGMKHMLEHMRAAGQVVTTTFPANFDYYSRLGWDWVQAYRSNRVPSHVLPDDPETVHVRAATGADRPRIADVYDRYSEGYRGMTIRDEALWDLLLKGGKSHVSYVYVYERNETIEGYLVLREGNGEETFLPEFLTVSPRARRALLGLLRRFHMNTKVFIWDAPLDDGLWSHFMHRDLVTKYGPSMIARVVDVALALQALKPSHGARGTLTLSIQDPLTEWNTGVFEVAFEDCSVSAKSTNREAQIEMDIQAFTQAFFGALPVAELRKQERAEVRSEVAFAAISELLDGPPMWSNGPL